MADAAPQVAESAPAEPVGETDVVPQRPAAHISAGNEPPPQIAPAPAAVEPSPPAPAPSQAPAVAGVSTQAASAAVAPTAADAAPAADEMQAQPPAVVIARAEPGRPEPPAASQPDAARYAGLSVLAARLSLETEMLRESQSNAGYAACVGSQITALPDGTETTADPGPTALAQRVYEACAKASPQHPTAAMPPYMSVTDYKAAVGTSGSDEVDVVTAVLASQLAFRLQTDKHLYRCINDGYLAKVETTAKRPLMFRALLASLNGLSNADEPLAGVILTSLQAFCADEQLQISVQK